MAARGKTPILPYEPTSVTDWVRSLSTLVAENRIKPELPTEEGHVPWQNELSYRPKLPETAENWEKTALQLEKLRNSACF